MSSTERIAAVYAAVAARSEAAEKLYIAAVYLRDAEEQANQRAVAHALLDERLDVIGSLVTCAQRGER